MHRASTRYTKRSSSTKARQSPGQFPDGLQVGEGGDLRRKILQRTHSIASRSASSSSATTASSSGSTNKSRSPGLESYMSAFLSPPRRSPTSMSSSPSSGYSPSPGSSPLSAFENYHRYSFYPTPKQALSQPAPGSKDREDVDITDYYSESIRKRGLYATPFGDLQNSSSSPPSSSCTGKREETDSMRDLDFGVQVLLVRQLLGTNGVPGIQRGQGRNALSSTSGPASGPSHVPPDGDIGEGVPMDSDSDRRRGVSFNTSVGGQDAGASDNVNIDGFAIGSGCSTTQVQQQPVGAVKLSRDVEEEWSPPAYSGDIINASKPTLDSLYEADICDVELTSLSPRVGSEYTFMNIMPPHAFDAFVPTRPPPCRIRTVSQLPTSVF
ncbi:hypothetical protein BDM02DRAFT_3112559 [Thelephora ganbajun]|uniref:Uncharacterized protein n=1 Tax=Thelephora ganbajun TaxID=370292 RepID=A0ACB6ZKD5_THEGA|nr:hypothetical protein BDM02DRAFT_3112559 [Thelephora ganbajun]